MANLNTKEIRDLAFDIGRMLESSLQDDEGRICLTPILSHLREKIGKEFRVDNFMERRSDLIGELGTRYGFQEIVLVKAGRGGGTWCIPEVAVYAIQELWKPFKVNALEIYRKYITRDEMFAIETFKNAVAKRAERAAQGASEPSTQVGFTSTEAASLTRHVTELENQVGFLKTAYEDERAARLAMEKKIERTDKMVEDNRKKIVDVELDVEMHQNELGSQVIEFKEKYDRLIDLQEANASQPPSKKRKLTAYDPHYIRTFWESMDDGGKLMPLEPFYERYKRDCAKTHQDHAGFEIFYGVTAKISDEEGSLMFVKNGDLVKGIPARMISGKLLKKK